MASSVTVRSCNRPPPESPTEWAASRLKAHPAVPARRAAGDLGEVLLGRESGPAPEQAVEMEFRQADMTRDLAELRLAQVFALDEFDGARHAREFAAVDEALPMNGEA